MSRERIVPVTNEPIPDHLLDQREDPDWEQESSDTRIALVMEWAAPLLERVQTLGLIGLKVDDDDEFNELVDEVYDGVRNRLTRQDLVRALMLSLGEKLIEETTTMANQFKRDMRALDRPDVIERFFRS